MYKFTLKIFYLILYSGDRRIVVGGKIYYFLYLAIFGYSVEESYYIPELISCCVYKHNGDGTSKDYYTSSFLVCW
jgi:hypothetical protein